MASEILGPNTVSSRMLFVWVIEKVYLRDMVQPHEKVDLSSSGLRYLVPRIGE